MAVGEVVVVFELASVRTGATVVKAVLGASQCHCFGISTFIHGDVTHQGVGWMEGGNGEHTWSP